TEIGVIDVRGGSAAIRDLSISGARPGISMLSSSASVDVEGVLISGASSAGILLGGGRMTATRIVVRDTAADAMRMNGSGLVIAGPAQAAIDQAVFLRNRFIAIGLFAPQAVLSLSH